jgi:hypothetical protein
VSTIKSDALTASTGTNTDLDLSGKGSGKVDIATGMKVGGTTGIPVSELRTGTDGELITWDSSGAPATVAVGSSTNVLTSNGAGAAPTFQAAAAGGAWTLISTAVASDSASLTITGLDATYDTYAVEIANIFAATNAAVPWIRFGDSGGVDSASTDYSYSATGSYTGDDSYGDEGKADAQCGEIILGTSSGSEFPGNATDEGFSGASLKIYAPRGSTLPAMHGTCVYPTQYANGQAVGYRIWGTRRAQIVMDRVQFLFSTGNITSGRMTVWGLAHA